jgi:hypothetical protein
MSDVSPRLLKAGLVLLDPNSGVPRGAIILQYNPESLTRRLQPQSVGEPADRSEIFRLKGPPIETITMAAEIDATDQLEFPANNPLTVAKGIQPALAALEMLVYPSSADLIANEALTYVGTIEILPMESALAVLVWGTSRVTPVRVTSIDITEDMFDPQLNPIHAKVTLALRVLNVNDTGFLNPAGALYMAYQIGKEALAASSTVQSLSSLGLTGLL